LLKTRTAFIILCVLIPLSVVFEMFVEDLELGGPWGSYKGPAVEWDTLHSSSTPNPLHFSIAVQQRQLHPLNAYVVQCSSRWLINQYLASPLVFLAPPSADPVTSIGEPEHVHSARHRDHQRFGSISKPLSSSSHSQLHGAFNRRADNMASFPTGAHLRLKLRKVTKSHSEPRSR